MGKGLGEYKGTVPITLVTQKRNCIGSTSSEIVALMGVRYAVMQEPSKNDTLPSIIPIAVFELLLLFLLMYVQ